MEPLENRRMLSVGSGSPLNNQFGPDPLDAGTPLTVTGTTPSLVGGILHAGITSLDVSFSEPVLGGGTSGNYGLRGLGPDALLGTADDTVVALTVDYAAGTTATLHFAPLTNGIYRLTVHDAITNAALDPLDGDGNGTAGGDWITDVVVLSTTGTFLQNAGATGLSPMGMWSGNSTLTGDFNGDGHPDLAVGNSMPPPNGSSVPNVPASISVLLGDAAGGLHGASIYATSFLVGSLPHGLAMGDFNGDGHVDLAVANYGYYNPFGDVGVLLGDGAGGFAAPLVLGVGSLSPLDVTVADFNGDHHDDVAVVGSNPYGDGHNVAVLLGDGAGGFAAPATFPASYMAYSVVAADFNRDGDMDLALSNGTDNNVGVLLGDGTGSFAAMTTYATGGTWAYVVALGDFNGDGKTDLAVNNHGNNSNPQTSTVGVLLGDGAGGFGPAATFLTGDSYSSSLTVADLNGDGHEDIAVAHWEPHLNGGNVSKVGVLLGDGTGALGAVTTFDTQGQYGYGVVAADFNGDTKLDLAVTSSQGDQSNWQRPLNLLWGDGAGAFPAGTTYHLGGSGPSALIADDLNGDGHADLVTSNRGSENAGAFLGDGTGNIASWAVFHSGDMIPWAAATGDFNEDGHRDIAVGTGHAGITGSVGILLGDGAGRFSQPTVFANGAWDGSVESVAVGDFNGDGHEDLVVANYDRDTVGLFLGNGAGSFAAPTTFASGGVTPNYVAVADLNGDHDDDVVVLNSGSDDLAVLMGNGAGGFDPAAVFNPGGTDSACVALADVDGDGRRDLVVLNANASSANNTVSVLLNNGAGSFSLPTVFDVGKASQDPAPSLALADFNDDGKLDLAVISGNYAVFCFGNGVGGFAAPTDVYLAVGGGVDAIATADFNGDGWLDPAVATLASNVQILLNTPVVTLYSPHGFQFDILSGGAMAGQLIQGTANAFDGLNRLQVNGVDFAPAVAATQYSASRTVQTPSQTIDGLLVLRYVFVPGSGTADFARTVEFFNNPTPQPIQAHVRVVGNLGAGADTQVFNTADGDTNVETSDQWIGTDDADGAGTPAVIHYLHGPSGLRPTSVVRNGDNLEWTYDFTVPATQTVSLGCFTIVRNSRAEAEADAHLLVTGTGFGGEAATDLWNSLNNFGFTPQDAATIGLYASTGSRFYVRNTNSTGYANAEFAYCSPTGAWLPIAGDWDGDGRDTIGLYDPQTSYFHLRNSCTAGSPDYSFGYGKAGAGWLPVAGDWDNDGVDEIGLFDPATAHFYLRNTNTTGLADVHFAYGVAGSNWIPLAGNWDGVGGATVGLYNPASASFHLRNSNTTGVSNVAFGYGVPGSNWRPIAGDWSGSGTTTVGLFDPATSMFYLRNSNTSGVADIALGFGPGGSGFSPIAGDWDASGVHTLLSAEGPMTATTGVPALSTANLDSLAAEAIARWALRGADAGALAAMRQAEWAIADLPAGQLGRTVGNQIILDRDAAGHGWFVDRTPSRDEEFAARQGRGELRAFDPRAVDRVDLLTVVAHEFGHLAGLDDLDSCAEGLMSAKLPTGIRRA